MNIKYLSNTIQHVEKYLSESLQSFFGISGKVTAQLYSKSEEFDYQTPYAMMYFKKVKDCPSLSGIQSVSDLTKYLQD